MLYRLPVCVYTESLCLHKIVTVTGHYLSLCEVLVVSTFLLSEVNFLGLVSVVVDPFPQLDSLVL